MWVIAALAPGAFILAAWVLWLLFNCVIAKWLGLEGLKATPPVAEAFRPRDWMLAMFRRPPRNGCSCSASGKAEGAAGHGCR